MFSLFLVASITLPAMGMPMAQFLQQQMERDPKVRGRAAGAKVSVLTNPQGHILDCRVLAVAGDEDAANRMCELLTRRKVRPATDPQGNPLYSVVSISVSYSNTRQQSRTLVEAMAGVPLPADIQLQTSAVKPGSPERRAELRIVIGEEGRLLGCEAEDSPGPFSQAACAYLATTELPKLEPKPGVPVRHARNFTVAFVPEGDAPADQGNRGLSEAAGVPPASKSL